MATIRQPHIEQPPVLPATPPIERLRLARLIRAGFRRALWLIYDFLVPVGIVAGFFWLQLQIDGDMAGFAGGVVVMLSVLAELGLLLVWSLLRDHVRFSCLE